VAAGGLEATICNWPIALVSPRAVPKLVTQWPPPARHCTSTEKSKNTSQPARAMAKSLAVLVFFMLVKTAFGDEEYEFWEASKLGDVEAMKEILNSVPELDLDYHDDDGQTPLLLAVLGHHAKAVQFLTSRGADIEVKGRWPAPEDAPLAVAARLGDLDLLDVLLLGGANVGAASGPDGRTPLMVAAAAGKLDAVDMLLGVGAAVDATRGDGTTAACWAARGGHGDVLRLLLDNGANVNHVSVNLACTNIRRTRRLMCLTALPCFTSPRRPQLPKPLRLRSRQVQMLLRGRTSWCVGSTLK